MSGVPVLPHLRNRSGRRTYRGLCWHRLGGGEHAHLDARFQFLVRLGHLLDQHLLADDAQSAHNDLIQHQKPGITKPAQGGRSGISQSVRNPGHIRTKNMVHQAGFDPRTPAFGVLGSVRKILSQTPHGTSQWDHCRITFCEFVEARNDATVLLQPAEHALDDAALPVLGAIKESR